MQVITEHWVAFPVLSLLVIYLICSCVCVYIPSSWFIPHPRVFFLQSWHPPPSILTPLAVVKATTLSGEGFCAKHAFLHFLLFLVPWLIRRIQSIWHLLEKIGNPIFKKSHQRSAARWGQCQGPRRRALHTHVGGGSSAHEGLAALRRTSKCQPSTVNCCLPYIYGQNPMSAKHSELHSLFQEQLMCDSFLSQIIEAFKKFIYLAVPGLSCSMWDLVPWPGSRMEPRCPALGAQY